MWIEQYTCDETLLKKFIRRSDDVGEDHIANAVQFPELTHEVRSFLNVSSPRLP